MVREVIDYSQRKERIMSALVSADAALPALPLPIPPVEGVNLSRTALMLVGGYTTPEQAMVAYRANSPASAMPYRRSYYVEPVKVREGRFSRRPLFRLKYTWNLQEPDTDRMIGFVHEDDLAAARVLIGISSARTYMAGLIRWELHEGRDSDDVIAMGRYDVWDLLDEVTDADIARLVACGKVINPEDWDFDMLYMRRTCPGCRTRTSVNVMIANIDSAECATCGIRPFLSRSMSRLLTGMSHDDTTATTSSAHELSTLQNKLLMHAVGWMGDVNAGVRNIHREGLHADPLAVLVNALDRSLIGTAQDAPNETGVSLRIAPLLTHLPPTSRDLATTAAKHLNERIRTGGPFSPVDVSSMHLLRALIDEARIAAT
jgi:hypothetical protein